MTTIFRYALARARGQILGWGIALALYGMYLVSFWDTMAANREEVQRLLEIYPRELLAFFGDMDAMFTPGGFLDVYFFSYMSLVVGIYAILTGSGLLAADEESGQLDLILAHPVSRTALFLGRLLAFVAATAAILAITWLGFLIATGWSSLPVGWGEMALPFFSLGAVLLLFGALALLLSMFLPSRRLAAMAAGLLLVASFFITSLARVDEGLKAVARLSPLNYYQGGEAINGLRLSWFAGLLVAAILFAALAWWKFLRREIRVGGEGSWQLPFLRRKAGLVHPAASGHE